MSDLIDTTEMYLRTVYELLEEGVQPLRARIAERLHQSGPTVSQTVARMERDGLLHVDTDRTIRLTRTGATLARDVMRKHRLAECLLTEVIGLEWEKVHDEACRWEHVISIDVEKRLVAILDSPTRSPYGNPIPGLKELGVDVEHTPFREHADPLADLVTDQPAAFRAAADEREPAGGSRHAARAGDGRVQAGRLASWRTATWTWCGWTSTASPRTWACSPPSCCS